MKQTRYKKVMALATILLAVNFASALAAPALAGEVNDMWGGPTGKGYVRDNSGLPANGGEGTDIRLVIANVIKVILGFLGILAVIIIVYAGFKWMLSGGSEEKVGEAKKMLVAGVIGLAIILSAYALANFVINNIYNATKSL